MVARVCGILPAWISYPVKPRQPERAGGATGAVVWILAKHKSDKGLLAHELTHVKQFYGCVMLIAALFGLAFLVATSFWQPLPVWLSVLFCITGAIWGGTGHWLLYIKSKWWRQRCEVQAYRAQLNFEPRLLDKHRKAIVFGRFIATRYDLDITADEARSLLL